MMLMLLIDNNNYHQKKKERNGRKNKDSATKKNGHTCTQTLDIGLYFYAKNIMQQQNTQTNKQTKYSY